jgi:uncharacterized alkaline shock family protein YloU
MENMTEPAPYIEGKTTIAPEVLLTIARLTTSNVEGVSRICHLPSESMRRLFKRGHVDEGVAIEIIDGVVYADLYVVLEHGYNVREVSYCIQVDVTRAITEMVGMQVGSVNIHVEDIDYPPENEA